MATQTKQPKKIKVEKTDEVADLEKVISGRNLVFVGYEKVNFSDLSGVRSILRKGGGALRVSKNTLMQIALKNKSVNPPDEVFKGMTALAITGDDFAAAGKAIAESEKGDKLKIKGGYHDGKVVDAAYVKKLANIPPRQTLYAMLVGYLQSPLSSLAQTLQAVADKKKAEASTPAA